MRFHTDTVWLFLACINLPRQAFNDSSNEINRLDQHIHRIQTAQIFKKPQTPASMASTGSAVKFLLPVMRLKL